MLKNHHQWIVKISFFAMAFTLLIVSSSISGAYAQDGSDATLTNPYIPSDYLDQTQSCTNKFAPTIESIDPPTKDVGSQDFVLTIFGTDFVEGSVVNWNGIPKKTLFISSSQLNITVQTSDISSVGRVPITVSLPEGNIEISNSIDFIVTQQEIITPQNTTLSGSQQFEISNNYSNSHFGISFDYPYTWKKSEEINTGRSIYQEFSNDFEKLAFVIYDFDPNTFSNLQDLVNSSIENGLPNVEVISTKNIITSGVEGIEIITKVDNEFFITEYYLRNDYVYVLNFLDFKSADYTNEISVVLTNLNWSDITYDGKIAKLSEYSEPTNEISVASAPTLKFPFRGTYRITSGYYNDSSYPHPNDNYNRYALDFINNVGTTENVPVYAAFSGNVYGLPFEASGCGNFVKLRYTGDSAYTTYYCHLTRFNVNLYEDVTQGDVIGYAGNTGASSQGFHIHFSYLYNGVSILPEPMSGYTGFRVGNVYTFTEGSEPTPTPTPPPANTITINPTLYYKANVVTNPGMCTNFWYLNNSAYLTVNTKDPATSTNTAKWITTISKPGLYKVEAYMPYHPVINWSCPSKTFNYDTSDAHYTIYSASGNVPVSGNQKPLSDQWLNLGEFQFDPGYGTKVSLTDLNDETSTTTTISVNDVRLTLLQETCYTLSLASSPIGNGTVQASPAPNCNNGTQYSYNTQVTITSYPQNGYLFTNWSGDASGTTSATTVTMTGNKSVTANFAQSCFTLATSVSPTGSGTIEVSPAPNCSNGTQYLSGTTIQLTTKPKNGMTFSNWSGDYSDVFNPLPIIIDTNISVTANIIYKVPTLTEINPTNIISGSDSFVLTVKGTNFTENSIVRWNGSDRLTTFVSDTQLSADILSSDISSPGIAAVTVFTPAPGGGTSNSINMVLYDPAPSITSLFPTSKLAGGSSFVLTITGANFSTNSIVRWNGSDRPTTFVNSTQITAAISAADIAAIGTAKVTVNNPSSGENLSNSLDFSVENPTPVLTTISPTYKTFGDAGFTLTLTGTSFISGSVVRWNGNDRATTYVSSTKLTAEILASDLSNTGFAKITIYNPGPGGGTTNEFSFAIKNPAPVASIMTPISAVTGNSDFELVVYGSNFLESSVIRWNGLDHLTTFESGGQLKTTIAAAEINKSGKYPVTVVNPEPGGGTSVPLTFTVTSNLPSVPVLSKPSTDAFVNTRTPTFSVLAATNAKQYEFQLSESSEFDVLLINPVITSTSYSLSSSQALEFGKQYYWRARTINAIGEYSDWSVANSFAVTILTSPMNRSYTTSYKPKLSWLSVPGAYTYEIKISNNADFSDPLILDRYPTTNYLTLTTPLPTKGVYFWKVRALTNDGWGNWMPAWSLTITEPLPIAPILVSPVNGFVTNNATPSLDWNSVNNATQYRIQIDTVYSFTHPLQDEVLSDGESIFTAKPLTNGKYYWRVSGINQYGLLGAWSSYRSFTIDTIAPKAPALYSPTDQKTVRGTPRYSWLSSSGAKYYQYQYGTTSGCLDPIFTSSVLTSTYTTPPLQQVGTYYWCTRAKDIAGNWSVWSASRKITILPTIPIAPGLISPISGAFVNDTTPSLQWKTVPYGFRYEVQVSRSSTFSVLLQDEILSEGLSTIDASTNGDGKYYWRVRAINQNGERGSWSSSRYFTLDTVSPVTPQMITPLNGATVSTSIPKLLVSTVTGVKYYRFQVSIDDNFATLLVDVNKTTNYYTLLKSQALPMGTVYWRIQTIDAAGNASSWSGPRSFTVYY